MLRDWVRHWFASPGARYEFRVQLQTDPETMPIEDASVEWPQEQSAYRTVAVIDIPPQESSGTR